MAYEMGHAIGRWETFVAVLLRSISSNTNVVDTFFGKKYQRKKKESVAPAEASEAS